MSDQSQFADKLSRKGLLIGIIGIFMGILTSFGGVDLPALIIFAFWAIILIGLRGEWGLIAKAFKRGAPAILVTAICFGYFIYTRIGSGLSFNETAKSYIAAILLFPPFIWAFRNKGYDRTIMLRAFVAGFVLALIILCIEALNGYAMYKMANPGIDPKELERNLGRGAFILITLLWPVVGAIDTIDIDRRIKLAIIILTIFISTRFGIDLNFVILALSSFMAFAAYKFPRFIIGSIVSGVAILLGAAPIIYGFAANFAKNNWAGKMPLSYERRADMWLYTIERIKEKPIYGWGLDSAKTFQDTVELGGYKWTAIQTHPHSAPLNIWLEGGVIGVVLFAIALVIGGGFLLSYVSKHEAAAKPLAGGLSACAIAWAVTYGAWQQWLWFLVIFAICYTVFGANRKKVKQQYSNELQEL